MKTFFTYSSVYLKPVCQITIFILKFFHFKKNKFYSGIYIKYLKLNLLPNKLPAMNKKKRILLILHK